MKKKRSFSLLGAALLVSVAFGILLCFTSALNNLNTDRNEESRHLLEDSIHRAAAACYAAEGSYPPDLAYMQEHYGVQIDEEKYAVYYDCFAQNLMPDITVLDIER